MDTNLVSSRTVSGGRKRVYRGTCSTCAKTYRARGFVNLARCWKALHLHQHHTSKSKLQNLSYRTANGLELRSPVAEHLHAQGQPPRRQLVPLHSQGAKDTASHIQPSAMMMINTDERLGALQLLLQKELKREFSASMVFSSKVISADLAM